MLSRSFALLTCLVQLLSHVSALSHEHLNNKRQTSPTYTFTGVPVPTYNISIPIDHFDESNTETYINRYWVNDTYHKPGGPVFFYDQGETGVTEQVAAQVLAQVNTTSSVMILAEKYGGVAVMWEHRYYGGSLPVPINSTTHIPEDGLSGYKYLTIEQALEDVVYFANNWQPEGCSGDECSMYSPSQVPWIWIGGSYPGLRGALLRNRNPEIIYATWSSSAPLQTRYDGSIYFEPLAAALPKNCSNDIETTIALADDIMSGDLGDESYEYLAALYLVAQYTQYGLNSSYDLNDTHSMTPFDIGSGMTTALTADFQFEGPINSTDKFCGFLETYNPNGQPTNTTNEYVSILSNPGDGTISDAGIAATYNSTVALEAYFYAWRMWWQYYWDVLFPDQSRDLELPRDFFADRDAWEWQVLTEIGWFQASNPDNVTIVSQYYNITSQRERIASLYQYGITAADFPPSPDFNAVNKYGGWDTKLSNTMFTDGQFDPWRGGTVMSDQTWIGAPDRQITQDIPACGTLPEGTDIFGLLYLGETHAPDLYDWSSEPYDETSPVYQGVQLFSKALDAWLPCFNGSSSR